MNQNEIIEFRQIRNVPEVINVTFDFVRQNIRPFTSALFRFAFPFIAVAFALSSYSFWGVIDSVSIIDSASGIEDVVGVAFQTFIAFFIAGVLVTIGSTTLIGVVHEFVRLYREDGPGNIQMQDVWQGVREKFWMLLFTLFGLGIVVAILSVVLVFVPFGGLGLYVLMVFGAFYFPLRIYEGRGFFQSFIVSVNLVQGSWWRTHGLILLFVLLSFVFSAVLIVPFIVVGVFNELSTISFEHLIDTTWFRVFSTVVLSVYYTALALIYFIPLLSLIFHYHSQRERHASVALLELVEEIGEV